MSDGSETYEGADGLQRDVLKLRAKEKNIYDALRKTAIRRFTKAPTFHNLTNVMVEAGRISAYYLGHFAMVSFVVNIALAGTVLFLYGVLNGLWPPIEF